MSVSLHERGLLAAPPPQNSEVVMERAVASFRVVGSPSFPHDDDQARERAGLAYDRAYAPLGNA
jgi:hypothetical protein